MKTGSTSLTQVTVKIVIPDTPLTLDAVFSGSVDRRAALTLGAVQHLFRNTSVALIAVFVVIIR